MQREAELYECPNCGRHVIPTEYEAPNDIIYYLCPKCEYSTWEPGEWPPVWGK